LVTPQNEKSKNEKTFCTSIKMFVPEQIKIPAGLLASLTFICLPNPLSGKVAGI